MAWRAAFSATSSSASRSRSVAVHTGRPRGSTNSPSTGQQQAAGAGRAELLAAGDDRPLDDLHAAHGGIPCQSPGGRRARVVRSGAARRRRSRRSPRAPAPGRRPPAPSVVVARPAGGALALGVVPGPAASVRRLGPAGARPAGLRHADLPRRAPACAAGRPRCRLNPCATNQPVTADPVGMCVAHHVDHVVESAGGRLLLEAGQHERARRPCPARPPRPPAGSPRRPRRRRASRSRRPGRPPRTRHQSLDSRSPGSRGRAPGRRPVRTVAKTRSRSASQRGSSSCTQLQPAVRVVPACRPICRWRR